MNKTHRHLTVLVAWLSSFAVAFPEPWEQQHDSECWWLSACTNTLCRGTDNQTCCGCWHSEWDSQEGIWRAIHGQSLCCEGKILEWDLWGGGCCPNPVGALACGVLVVGAGRLWGSTR